ncbi:MAG: TRAP transporter small permease subunit [Hydrogenophaga sp.]|uniref:TRAP transporter small permease n=1 Tax=Hydrogenophaga sp. TaxID=1904254 RepID=UPI00169D7A12|nr:TRAP transporter small permease [Hydrogenophaga sp.]NIM40610.1 TRAP transporter small permease subunit [Hydrogenophaga sp.]NIN26085.1 TRAP transporter small permease subunit [Hydrogenophaga sp.]NIN30950.1 TRAP transporter small permease subunit [Hydrogenophaga sp.]NIN54993.1 TRAP transporter small permease subunit [Hydrogenophaga sp.]NIO51036.1 TRAP transporter small permease subunit [Hydrogenophaga sp.]
MRKSLDVLYLGAGWLAALFMIGVLAMVLLSIVSRLVGFYVPGTDAYAGYAMAGAGFLALAHTLKHNEHIRVTLIIGKLTGGARRGMELWALSVAVLMSGALAWYSWRLVWQSHSFHDISTAADATPLWIPQLLMGIGCTVLLIALLDEWVLEWRGQRVRAEGDTRHE